MTTTAVKHPAKFHPGILALCREALAKEVERERRSLVVLDPFAGVGGVHELGGDYLADKGRAEHEVRTVGVELEEEWASAHPDTLCMDAIVFLSESWAKPEGGFDVVCSSPCYGNRMADHHNAKDDSKRNTYRHSLGRELSKGSSAAMQWGDEYRNFHEAAMRGCRRVARPGGLVLWNVKNHYRGGQEQRVVEWHLNMWLVLGCTVEWVQPVPASGNGMGQNGKLRTENEMLMAMRLG